MADEDAVLWLTRKCGFESVITFGRFISRRICLTVNVVMYYYFKDVQKLIENVKPK